MIRSVISFPYSETGALFEACESGEKGEGRRPFGRTRTLPNPSMTARSMFLAPVWTTSRSDLTASWITSPRSMSAFQFFSRNSRTVLDDRPIALACACVGEGYGVSQVRCAVQRRYG